MRKLPDLQWLTDSVHYISLISISHSGADTTFEETRGGGGGLVACPQISIVPTLGRLFFNVAFSRAKSVCHIHVPLVQTLTQGLFRTIHRTKKIVFRIDKQDIFPNNKLEQEFPNSEVRKVVERTMQGDKLIYIFNVYSFHHHRRCWPTFIQYLPTMYLVHRM